jgi:hypothetical protein
VTLLPVSGISPLAGAVRSSPARFEPMKAPEGSRPEGAPLTSRSPLSAEASSRTGPGQALTGEAAVHRMLEAQRRMDRILELANRGRNFTPAQLLAMQAGVYQASQELDLAGRVVEKAAAGVKQVLQTQL